MRKLFSDSSLRRLQPQVPPCSGSCNTSARCTRNHPGTDQVGLAHFFHSRGLLTDCQRQGIHAHRAATVPLDQGSQHCAVQAVQPKLIDIEDNQRRLGRTKINNATGVNICEIANATQ